MAGLSRRRAPVALRSGASTCDRGRRHVGSPHAFCGTTSRATNEAKYGQGSLHSASPAGRELFTVAAAKNGLGPQDIAPPLSFFHGVRVEADGALTSTGSAGSGATVDLLIHLPVIVMIANTAHPLDPAPQFPTTSLEVLAWKAADELGSLDDLGPEYQRAVLNTEDAWTASNLEEIA